MRNKPIKQKKPKPYRSMMQRGVIIIDWNEFGCPVKDRHKRRSKKR